MRNEKSVCALPQIQTRPYVVSNVIRQPKNKLGYRLRYVHITGSSG